VRSPSRSQVRIAVLVLVALVMAWPALRRPPTDGYPLSTYPMFADDRGDTSTIATAVGITVDGDEARLSPEELSGSDEPMQAISTAAAAVREGRAAGWCAQVARRVTDPDISAIQVRRETHDVVAHFTDDAEPIEVEVVAACEVPR
jgi:hypothetical protein